MDRAAPVYMEVTDETNCSRLLSRPRGLDCARRRCRERQAARAAAVRACHIVTPSPRNDLVADAPPFLVIARKYGADTEALVFNLVGPHTKMNFSLSRLESKGAASY
jgi:hypothetical protein